ncbi:MAG TPA: 2-dehydropantoate 2-reductase [Candidatus Binataceae bacterium]|nr:2-dehydropantoate 2-reductase [Candidatus Binataceae bacterium]
MRIAVLGCGAIGGTIAGCLTRAGHDVTPIVGNPRIESALRGNGYTLRDLDGNVAKVPVSCPPVKTPAEAAGIFDILVTATPSTALETGLRDMIPFLAETGRVVTCQNGLPEDRAVGEVGNRVIGCVVGWGATMSEPGVYQRTSGGRFQIGRANASCPAADDLAPLLQSVAPVEVVNDLSGVRWSKLAINCVTSPFGAIGGAPLGALLMSPKVRRLALEVFAEVAAVARAEQVKLRPVAGTLDIGRVAINDRERAARLSPTLLLKHVLLLIVGYRFRRMRSSMLYALERGRALEIDFLNGEIVRRGARHGVPTPVNSAIVACVRAIERKEKLSSPQGLGELCDALSVASVAAGGR